MLPDGTTGFNFQSTFLWPSHLAESVLVAGSTANLEGASIGCDTIFIDIDNASHVDRARQALISLGFGFEEFSTGNRGVHFHIPIELIEGPNVPYSVIQWLKRTDLWQFVDPTIYRAGSIYRCEGAIHQKTGKPKTKVAVQAGIKPTLVLICKPPAQRLETLKNSPEAMTDFMRNLLSKRGEGHRHVHCYILWNRGREAGLEEDVIVSWIHWWNDHGAYPSHSSGYLDRKIKQFKRRACE